MKEYANHEFEGVHAARCSWCGGGFNAMIHVIGKEAPMNNRPLYDDSRPVHAALSQLIDDGYATDKQRQAARLALGMIEDLEEEMDKELRRWQDAIRDKLIDMGAPDWKIDGAGCDSGDPLDFTLAEVGQGVGYFIDQLDELRATPSPSLAAREAAAEEIDRYYDGLVGFNIRVKGAEEVAAIIERHCSPVSAAGGDEDGEPNPLLGLTERKQP